MAERIREGLIDVAVAILVLACGVGFAVFLYALVVS